MTAATPDPASGPSLLRMDRITKSFSGVEVLSQVSFDLRAGEVHVLAGENGAGKSTLIKVLAGVHGDYDGVIELDGEAVQFSSPQDATAHGIAVIYQEMSLIGSLSVADNIFLGREKTFGDCWMQPAAQRRAAGELLREIAPEVDATRPVEHYPAPVQQLIEIAKALSVRARIVVMDEPTSSLSEPEVERLFSIVGVLKDRGVGIVYITHKMEEIYRIADRITVLRDGHFAGTAAASDLPAPELIRRMVGRELTSQFPQRAVTAGSPILRAENISVRDPAEPSRLAVENVSFDVRSGEILGIAGLRGSGNSTLLNAMFGVYGPLAGGGITFEGAPFKAMSPRHSVKRRFALVTNDRKAGGLVMEMSAARNITLATLRSLSPLGWLRWDKEREAAARQASALRLRAQSLAQEVSTLSGGNQQKVVVAKWLESTPRLFLLDEPTRGVDVGVKYEIYELMNRLTSAGCSIVLVTSELPELLAMADRIIVMCRGRRVAAFGRGEATQESIIHAAMGGETGTIH